MFNALLYFLSGIVVGFSGGLFVKFNLKAKELDDIIQKKAIQLVKELFVKANPKLLKYLDDDNETEKDEK